MILPSARRDRLVIQELPDETLVYDLERHHALCLNRTSALVWSYCDGRTSLEEVEAVLERELKVPGGEEAVWVALRQLQRAHLLQDKLTIPETAEHYTRRVFLKKMAIVGAVIMVPTVISIVAPTAVHAQTCIDLDCTKDKKCPGGSVLGQACDPLFTPPCGCTCQDDGTSQLRCRPP